MREGLEKKLMLDLLMHPAQVHYKDDQIAVLIPSSTESLAYHLKVGTGDNRYTDSVGQRKRLENFETKYVVATRCGERFLGAESASSFGGESPFHWEYAPYTEQVLLKKYPTLINAFDEVAQEIKYLPLIKNHTKELIEEAVKRNPANVRHLRNLTLKDKKYWIRHDSRTFEYMEQNPQLVKYAMDNTDVGLGKISSYFCTASICKKGLRKNPLDLKYVPNHHKSKELIMYAINQDPRALKEISHPTLDMYVTAAKAGKNGWNYIPESLKKKVKRAL